MHAIARHNPIASGPRLAFWYTAVIAAVFLTLFTAGYHEVNLIAGTVTVISFTLTAVTSLWTWAIAVTAVIALKTWRRTHA